RQSMPPKGKKGANAAKGKQGEEEPEEPLQAVILADSYETRFNPFTLEKPRCLLPLANTPLIEYTCELLANAGVEEVFLYSGNHTDQVEEYLQHSKWTKDTSPFSLEIIRSTSRSIGDAMRDLDQKQLIKGDFICVYGDVVANVPLEAALSAHKARRAKDKKSIMTMVLREAGDYHRTKSQHMRPCFVVDPTTDACVHYEQMKPHETPKLDVPDEVLKEHVEIDVREDLIDCGIDICTPEVLAQWSDNFDWQMPRRGFVHGVLKDFETFQLTIHTHIVREGYAARVKNLQAYDAISKDVVSRWAYPLSPDTNLLPDQSYQLQRGGVYKEDGVFLARSSVISRKSVLGKATSIGDASVISNSVIGRRCVIGKRVRIEGAYIWDDARIGDDTVIDTAIVASEASVGRGCRIEKGALLSYGVNIANGTTVKGNTRVTRLKRKRGYEEDEVVKGQTDPSIVGEGGTGFKLDFDDDEEEAYESMLAGTHQMALETEDDTSSQFSDEEEDEEDDLDHEHHRSASRSESFTSIGSDESGEAKRSAADFHHEAANSIFDSLQKGQDPDTIQLELKALTLAANAEGKQIRRAVAVAFAKRMANLVETGKSAKEAASSTVSTNQLLVERCVDADSAEEQVEFLLFLQTDLVHRQQGAKLLLFASFQLANNDLADADGFRDWWEDERSSASDELKSVKAETKQVVDFLQDQEESSDEDDDDDDDDDDED
ncbi:translation initiation factor-like protein eif-2b epsilon subunit, partial [Hortaea werneckii]